MMETSEDSFPIYEEDFQTSAGIGPGEKQRSTPGDKWRSTPGDK